MGESAGPASPADAVSLDDVDITGRLP